MAANDTGSVRADEVLTREELRRRFNWQDDALRTAVKRGLRLIRLGRQSFVLGRDVLALFERLAVEQASKPDANGDGEAAE